MSKTFQWLVVRGRVGIRSEDSRVILELDPEGSAYCVLSAQDTQEISAIITDQARTIWEASDVAQEPPAEIDGNAYQACSLRTESGTLQLIVHDSMPLLALSLQSGTSCSMNITQAVALVQILQHMGKTLRSCENAGAA